MRAALLALLLLPGIALGQHTFTFTRTDPTTRTDGSALAPNTDLKAYKLNCSGPANVTTTVTRANTTSVTGNTRSYVWSNAVTASGTYACRMTAIDTGDRESAWSNTASVAKFAAPSAPTDLGAQ